MMSEAADRIERAFAAAFGGKQEGVPRLFKLSEASSKDMEDFFIVTTLMEIMDLTREKIGGDDAIDLAISSILNIASKWGFDEAALAAKFNQAGKTYPQLLRFTAQVSADGEA